MPQARSDLRWWTLSVLCLSVLLVMLDNTIVNVALPTISRGLNASTQTLQWVVDAYSLTFAGLLLVSGNLGDRLGRRRVLQTGLVFFAIFCIAAGISRNTGELIAARAAMGIAAATVYPATLAILNNVFTNAKERAMAIGIWAGVSGIAVALGPISGGLLLDHFAWDSVFFVSAPVAVIALVAGRFLVPESRDPSAGRFDLIGAILSIAGIALLTWSLIEAPSHGWDSAGIMAGIAGAVVILAVFAWQQAHRPDPLLDVKLFRNPQFAIPSLAISLAFFGLFGFSFLITQYFQVVRGYSPLRGGVATLPFAFFIAVFSPIAIMLMRRFGAKIVIVAGLLLMIGGFLVASVAPENASYWRQIIAAMSLMSAGLALISSPATNAIMGALPLEKAGVGSAVNDTTREVGGVLGVAVLGSVLNSVYSHRALWALTSLGAPHSTAVKAGGSIVAGLATAARFPAASQQAAGIGVRDAFVTGLHWGSVAAAVSTAGAVLLVLAFFPGRVAPAAAVPVPRPADDEPAPAEPDAVSAHEQ